MDIGTVLSVVQTLLDALQCTQLNHVFTSLNFKKDELNNFAKTVETVKAVLLDAESKGDELSIEAQRYVDELKYAILEADDLLDEFVTLAERKHHKFTKGGSAKALDKARALLSRFKELHTAYNMSKQVINVKKKLDAIADDHNKFDLKIDSKPIRQRKEDTYCYVKMDIIGRDAEKEEIVNRLLETNAEGDVSFLSIVGIGGLGKTALAQLVFNDDKIKAAFPTRRWACVGVEDTQHLNENAILAKILETTEGESLPRKIEEELRNRKYLIILDDVWIENRGEWLKLEGILKGGARGSCVLVTTRSSTTASVVGDKSPYHLKGLSDEDSWRLFEMVAFGKVGGQENPSDLVEIGKKVVKKCANVPLAIRVAGSLLFGQLRPKWESFESSGFANMDPKKNGILPILKFSYYNLDSPLKSCFSYCALFPKDYLIEKEMLIRLWEAQGYIVTSGSERKEDVAEEYFSILLRRCFFQDVRIDDYGEIWAFKVHDLLHDVAQQVAGKEIGRVDHFTGERDEGIVHLNVDKSINIKGNSSRKTLRTLFFNPFDYHSFELGALLKNWMSLRALVVTWSKLENIPEEIGKLIHLRLLDLSWNVELEKLPKSITKLHNLETLLLIECESLRELPNDIEKLVKLRCLDLSHCFSLLEIPESIGKLTSLVSLPYFKVKNRKSLEGLRSLHQLKGSLRLEIGDLCSNNEKVEKGEGQLLVNKERLHHIRLVFPHEDKGGSVTSIIDYEEVLFERLQPHENLKTLKIWYYKGGGLPSWASGHKLRTSLSNLVIMNLCDCNNLKYLSGLGKLRHLKKLELNRLGSLEYMEEEEESRNRCELGEDYLFFPSLQILKLEELSKLKGWWRVEGKEDDPHCPPSPSFPHLSELTIRDCKQLALIPAFPSVGDLIVRQVNERLRKSGGDVNEKEEKALKSNEVEGFTCSTQCRMETDKLGLVTSLLSRKALQCLTELKICDDKVVETLEQEVEVWRFCSSSLRILYIYSCSELKSVYKGGLEHLSALEELTIACSENLTLSDEEDEKSSLSSLLCPPHFSHTLRYLGLGKLPKMVNLPEWMQHLNSLQSLEIISCESLESLPKWMQHLTSLTQLKISCCSKELEEGCSRNPPGEYWPYISHIPNIKVSSE